MAGATLQCLSDGRAGLGVAGTPDEARDQFRDAVGMPVADYPIVYVPRSVSGATRDWTIETLAPEQLRARSL